MKQLIDYINEAWGNRKTGYEYKRDLNELFDKMAAAQERLDTAKAKGKYVRPDSNPVKHLAKYPVSILIDKAGYSPKKIQGTKMSNYNKLVLDEVDYGEFILRELEAGKFTKLDLLKWWGEYDSEVKKGKWFDPKFIVKQIDPDKVWSIYDPTDDSCLNAIIERPYTIFYYTTYDFSAYRLTKDELEQVTNFWADPVNQPIISKVMKTLRKNLEAQRPTFTASAKKNLEAILEHVHVNGSKYDFSKLFNNETSSSRYYDGNNFRDKKANAYYSIVMKAIEDHYDLKFNGPSEDNLEKFIKDASGLTIVMKTKSVDSDTSDVHSSSFTTFYKEDIDVTIYHHTSYSTKKNPEEGKKLFSNTYKGVIVATDYYSGGWN